MIFKSVKIYQKLNMIIYKEKYKTWKRFYKKNKYSYKLKSPIIQRNKFKCKI